MIVTNSDLFLKKIAQIPGYYERENSFTLETPTKIKTPSKIIFSIGNNGYVGNSIKKIDLNEKLNWVSGEENRADADYRNGIDFYIYAERIDLVNFSYKFSSQADLDKRTYTKIARFYCSSTKEANDTVKKGDIVAETLRDKKDDVEYVKGKNSRTPDSRGLREEIALEPFNGGEVVSFTSRNRATQGDCSTPGLNKIIGFALNAQSPGKSIEIQTSGDIVLQKKLVPGETYFLGKKGEVCLRSELPDNRYYDIEVGVARNETTLSIAINEKKKEKSFIYSEKKNGLIIPLFGDITKEKTQICINSLREFKEIPAIVVIDKEKTSEEEKRNLKSIVNTGAKIAVKLSSQKNQKGISALRKEVHDFKNSNKIFIDALFIDEIVIKKETLGYIKQIRDIATLFEINSLILSTQEKISEEIQNNKPADIIIRDFTSTLNIYFPLEEFETFSDFRSNGVMIKGVNYFNYSVIEDLLKSYGWVYVNDNLTYSSISSFIPEIAKMVGNKTYSSPSLHHSLVGSHFIHTENSLSKEVFGVIQDGTHPVKKSDYKQLYSIVGDLYNSINEEHGYLSVGDWCLQRGYNSQEYFYASPPPYFFEGSANPTVDVEELVFNSGVVKAKNHNVVVRGKKARIRAKEYPAGYNFKSFTVNPIDANSLQLVADDGENLTFLSSGKEVQIVFEGGIGYTKAKQTFIDSNTQKMNKFESSWITLNSSLSNYSYVAHHFMGEQLENLIVDVVFKKDGKTYKIDGSDYKESGAPTYASSGYYLSSLDVNRFSINFLDSISLPNGIVIMDSETSGEFKFTVYKPEIIKTYTKSATFDVHVNSTESVEVVLPSPELFNNVLRYTKAGKGSGKVVFKIKKEFIEKPIGKEVSGFYVVDSTDGYSLNSEGSFIEFVPVGEYGSRTYRIGKYSDYVTFKDTTSDVIRRNITVKKKEGGYASAMFALDIALKPAGKYQVKLPIKSSNKNYLVHVTPAYISNVAENIAVINKQEETFELFVTNNGANTRALFEVRIDNIVIA